MKAGVGPTMGRLGWPLFVLGLAAASCGDDDGTSTPTDTGTGTATNTATITSTGTGTGTDTGSSTGTGTVAEPSSCADPIELTMGETAVGDNYAGQDITDGTCQLQYQGSGESPDQVYRLVPTGSDPIKFSLTSTEGTDFGVAVQTACADLESEVACADALYSGGVETEVAYYGTPEPGEPLYVVVSGFTSTSAGPYELLAETYTPVCGDGTRVPPEVCDDGGTEPGDGCDENCALECDMIPVSGGVTNGDNGDGFAASVGSCTGLGPELIYAFTPTVTGAVTVTVDPSAGGADLGFYVRTDCQDPSTQVVCQDGAEAGGVEESTFDATAGVPVAIFVDGFDSLAQAGAFTLTIAEAASCGDGVTTYPEECDDMNANAADGCDACLFTNQQEQEPNDAFGQATPVFPGRIIGTSAPSVDFDHDWLSFDVPGPASTVTVEVTAGGAFSCGPAGAVDPEVELVGTDGSTQLGFNDDEDATTECAATQATGLAAGTYFVRTSGSATNCSGCSYDYEVYLLVD
jgi:cysteine-rich repeat protein